MLNDSIDPPESSGDAWRLVDHTAAAGLSQGSMWLKAAKAGLMQARHGGGEMWGLWIGALHCVQGVHHVRKCVEMASANVPADVAADISSYLVAFDVAVPDLKTIRDVLEHYEDGYALGKGNLQQPDLKTWQRTMSAALSEAWTILPKYADDDPERPVIVVSDRYALDLTSAVQASQQLLFSLWSRTRNL